MASRRTYHLYQSKRWRDMRKRLFRQNPLCVLCYEKGIMTEAKELDHIKQSSKLSLDDFFNEDNLQFLCVDCHRNKTAEENQSNSKYCDIDENGYPIGNYNNGYYTGKK